MKSKYISFGKILNFHGIKGEVKLGYTQGRESWVSSLSKVYLEAEDEFIPLTFQYVKFAQKSAIAKFTEFNSINDIIPYKGCILYVEKETAGKGLEEDEYLINDLIGMEVYSDNLYVGVVTGVSNNGASDLLNVKTKSGKISLIPFVKAIVTEVKIKERKIIIINMDGLLE